jgi:hypothetical protein
MDGEDNNYLIIYSPDSFISPFVQVPIEYPFIVKIIGASGIRVE